MTLLSEVDVRAVAARFVGAPFADKGRDPSGWDCWGLLRFVGAEVGLGHFPSYVDAYASAHGDVGTAIAAHLGNWRRLERPRAPCGILFRRAGVAFHVGLAVSRNEMLHVTRDAEGGSTIERFDTIVWSPWFAGAWLPQGKEEPCSLP